MIATESGLTLGDVETYLDDHEGLQLKVWFEGGRFTVVALLCGKAVARCSEASLLEALDRVFATVEGEGGVPVHHGVQCAGQLPHRLQGGPCGRGCAARRAV